MITLPKNSELARKISAEIEQRGFVEIRFEGDERSAYLFARETLEGFSQALTDPRLHEMASRSVAELRSGQGVSIQLDHEACQTTPDHPKA